MKKKSEQQLDWLMREMNKDKIELEKEKNDLINKIKKMKNEDLLPKKPEKLSLWKRLKMILMGY
jgi:hypothetical protein